VYKQIAANKRRTVVLMFLFFLLVGFITLAVGWYFKNYSITLIALMFSFFYLLWSYFGSAKLALAVNGAEEIQKKDNPRLWRIVENLCITTGLPMPKVYVISDPALNAFATGRDPKHSAIAVTQGLLDMMNDSELEAVVAHELGHIQNYDIRVSMIAFGLVAIVSIISDFVLRWLFWGSVMGDDNDSPGGNNPLFLIFGIVALILAPIVATLIQLSISRKREYLADATSVLTTRYPEGMISALEKIQASSSTVKKQNASTAHLFFANPLSKKSFSNLFSTHPPIEERIKALKEMGSKA
jgi:heat shock protein HtpX